MQTRPAIALARSRFLTFWKSSPTMNNKIAGSVARSRFAQVTPTMFALFADRCAVVLLYLSMVGAGFAAHLPPAELAPFFAPPQQYRSDFGQFRSPLLFTNGTPVRTPADWQRRRSEILSTWQKIMGPWPPLIEHPRVGLVNTIRRDNITQSQLRMEIALGREMVDGLLLVPESSSAEKRPAVVVVYYDAETGVGLGAPMRDYAWQLARRGFVTLSIGKPNAQIDLTTTNKPRTDPYLGPADKAVHLQPLSALA